MTNGVTVPKEYKYLMEKPRRPKGEIEEKVMAYLSNHKNNSVDKIAGGTSVGKGQVQRVIYRLSKRGMVSRQKRIAPIDNGAGGVRYYVYTLLDKPLAENEMKLANGDVITHILDLPDIPIDDKALTQIRDLSYVWIEQLDKPNGEHIIGVLEFRRWAENHVANIKRQRENIINDYHGNRATNSDVGDGGTV